MAYRVGNVSITIKLISWVVISSISYSQVLPAYAAGSPKIPVVLDNGEPSPPCDHLAEVTNLNPKGDNFLSVRAGPDSARYQEIDRMHQGQKFLNCSSKLYTQGWIGVVYGRQDLNSCVPRFYSRAPKVEYSGPCKSGWVHKNYVKDLQD